MQRILLTGNLGRDPELRSTQGGDQVCALNVGVKQGWGDKASSNWFRCSVWGKRADTVANNLRKGQKVTVIGELTIGDYQGKPQYDVRVDDLDWQPSGDRPAQSAARSNAPASDDLNDDVPF